MRVFTKLLLVYLLSNIAIYLVYYWDTFIPLAEPRIGINACTFVNAFYGAAVVLYFILFNLIMGISILYLRSKGRGYKDIVTFIWVSIPILFLAISLAFLHC